MSNQDKEERVKQYFGLTTELSKEARLILKEWNKEKDFEDDKFFKRNPEMTESTSLGYFLLKEALIQGVDWNQLLQRENAKGEYCETLSARISATETYILNLFWNKISDKNLMLRSYERDDKRNSRFKVGRMIPTSKISVFIEIWQNHIQEAREAVTPEVLAETITKSILVSNNSDLYEKVLKANELLLKGFCYTAKQGEILDLSADEKIQRVRNGLKLI